MKIKVFFFFLLFHFIANSQGGYIVFKTIGDVRYFSGKTRQWELLKPKDSISNDTKIKFSPNTSLVIFDSKYRIYEVKKDGEFLLKNTINTKTNSTSEEMQKAVKYFVERTFEAHEGETKQKVKAAVYRGGDEVFPWDSTDIAEDTFSIHIDFSKSAYPVKISLNNYKLIIYNDTDLRIPSNTIQGKDYNIMTIGDRSIHLRNVRDLKELKQMNAILNNKNLDTGTRYTLFLEYCISRKYYSLARITLLNLKESDPNSYLLVKENLKDDPVFLKLESL
jgi:hypothetical protein